MRPPATLNESTPAPTKSPGSQPLPGYVLLAPLGRGGFGEVWRCEVPGGLQKAIKFVAGNADDVFGGGDAQLRQELEAFQQMKEIRHPFLLTLERVEVVGGELVMVMELADRHIGERFQECREAGLPGIPRDELLGYLREAAEALDVISARYGLQHLDIKPANLFLTAGHVQVGDYGLVSKLDGGASRKNRGLTPRYAAPEVLGGAVHTRSDEYSLALVYQELLTGTFPFTGRNSQQLMFQHMTADPDLTGLPDHDRDAVGRALAKNPDERFPTCSEFVAALLRAGDTETKLWPSPRTTTPAAGIAIPAFASRTRGRSEPDEPTEARTIPAGGLPQLVGVRRRPAAPPVPTVVLPDVFIPTPPPAPLGVVIPEIVSVVPVERLRGGAAPEPFVAPDELVRAVLLAAGGKPDAAPDAHPVTRAADGSWGCRFLTTLDPRLARVKLDLVRDENRLTLDDADPLRVVLRKPAPVPEVPAGLFGGVFGKKPPPPPPSGLEVVVRLPERGGELGEVVTTARVFGTPPPAFARVAPRALAKLLAGVRRHLGNFAERRRHARVASDLGVTLFPLLRDASIGPAARGRCRNVSAGGMSLVAESLPPADYYYVAFDRVSGAAGLAVLLRALHRKERDREVLVSGRYKLELLSEELPFADE